MLGAAPVARAAEDQQDGIVELVGAEGLEASRVAALRCALKAVLSGAPVIRRATVYEIARGHAVVRLMTGRGWIPVLLAPSDWSDARVLMSRLQSALTPTH